MRAIDDFLDAEYDFNRYNCGHFVADVWRFLTGEDIDGICRDFVHGNSESYFSKIRQRTKLREPESPCVVIMQAPNALPHAGVYIKGRVLHLTEAGANYQELCLLKVYHRLSFFK